MSARPEVIRAPGSLRTPAVTTTRPDDLADDDLAVLALGADPDAPVPDDAVSLDELLGREPGLLPEWYMPAAGVAAPLRGWRRRVVWLVIAALVTITAFGLCNTYGDLLAS